MTKTEMVRVVDEYVGGGGHPAHVIEALSQAMMETAAKDIAGVKSRALFEIP